VVGWCPLPASCPCTLEPSRCNAIVLSHDATQYELSTRHFYRISYTAISPGGSLLSSLPLPLLRHRTLRLVGPVVWGRSLDLFVSTSDDEPTVTTPPTHMRLVTTGLLLSLSPPTHLPVVQRQFHSHNIILFLMFFVRVEIEQPKSQPQQRMV